MNPSGSTNGEKIGQFIESESRGRSIARILKFAAILLAIAASLNGDVQRSILLWIVAIYCLLEEKL